MTDENIVRIMTEDEIDTEYDFVAEYLARRAIERKISAGDIIKIAVLLSETHDLCEAVRKHMFTIEMNRLNQPGDIPDYWGKDK